MGTDANNTRFHLLMGRADWAPLTGDGSGLCWDGERGSLSLKPLPLRIYPARRLHPQDRRGAVRNPFGNFYWISEGGASVRFLAAEGQQAADLWAAGGAVAGLEPESSGETFRACARPAPPALLKLRGLALTEHHYLVAGVLDPAGLLIFDLHAGMPPAQVLWPDRIPFAPFDMAPAPGGGVWILDLGETDRYWGLDGRFQVRPVSEDAPVGAPDFQPAAGPAQGRIFQTGIHSGPAASVAEEGPVAIEGLPDGSVLILSRGTAHSSICRYRDGRLRGQVSLEILEGHLDARPAGAEALASAMSGHDFAFVPGRCAPGDVSGVLYVATEDGEVKVTSGLAVNPQGKEIQVTPDQCASLNRRLAVEENRAAVEARFGSPPGPVSLYVVLCYLECETDPAFVPAEPCRSQEESTAPSRITESFELKFSLDCPEDVSPPGQAGADGTRRGSGSARFSSSSISRTTASGSGFRIL